MSNFEEGDRIRVTDYENAGDTVIGKSGTILWRDDEWLDEDEHCWVVEVDDFDVFHFFESEMELLGD